MTYLPQAPDRGSIQTQAIILIIVGFLCASMIPSIFGIIALVQMDSDPVSAKKMNKIGWIILAVIIGIGVLAAIAYVVIMIFVVGVAATTGS